MCSWKIMADTFNHMSLAASASLQQQAADGRFTQAQMDEYAFKAIGVHMRTNPSTAGLETMSAIGERYCHVHGWGTHTGKTCGRNKNGCKAQYWRADSRAGPGHIIDKTRVIGHENFNHSSRRSSEENAKLSANPLSFPDTPGNENVYTVPPGKSGCTLCDHRTIQYRHYGGLWVHRNTSKKVISTAFTELTAVQ
jgi:hypothetical protein